MSVKEKAELALIEENIQFDEEAEVRGLAPDNELTGAQMAAPIKRTRERLVNSMRAQLTSLEQAILILPAVPSNIGVKALEDE